LSAPSNRTELPPVRITALVLLVSTRAVCHLECI
jgi:hypothetical protein